MSSKPKKWGSFSKKDPGIEQGEAIINDIPKGDHPQNIMVYEDDLMETHYPPKIKKERVSYDAKAEIDQLKDQLTILNKTLADYRHESANQTMIVEYFLERGLDFARKYKGSKKKRWAQPNTEKDYLDYVELEAFMKQHKETI